MMKLAPWPIAILIASFLCPTELSLYLGGLRLPPHRVALLMLLPIAVYRLLTRRDIHIRNFDYVMVAYNAAILAVFSYHGEQLIGPELTPSNGFAYGGSLALEGIGGYLVARAWIRDLDEFKATLKLLIASALLVGLIALPDMFMGEYVVHNLLRSSFGGDPLPPVEYRLGLARATSVFDHPIHLGTYCSILVALAWGIEKRVSRRIGYAAVAIAATLTAMSSAPILCIIVQVILITAERLTRGIPQRLSIAAAVMVVLYAAASVVATRSPIAFIATGMTLDSWTGYYRLMIWEYGMENVMNHPIFGLGLADWERPKWMASSTIDAFWLVTAMRTGLPTLMLLIVTIILLGTRAARGMRQSKNAEIRAAGRGWLMSLGALILIACTVHFWNVLYAYFFFFLGLAGWIADPKRSPARAQPALHDVTETQRRPAKGPQPFPQGPIRPQPAY